MAVITAKPVAKPIVPAPKPGGLGAIPGINYGQPATRAPNNTGGLGGGSSAPGFMAMGGLGGDTAADSAFRAKYEAQNGWAPGSSRTEATAGTPGRQYASGGYASPAAGSGYSVSDYSSGSPGYTAFDQSVLGPSFKADQAMYDKMSGDSYNQALRTLNPTFDRSRAQFDQRMINQGMGAGSTGYNTALDAYNRDKNDAYGNAAFNAMGYGASRLDADRNAFEGNRQFDATMREGARSGDNNLLVQNATNRRGQDLGHQTDMAQLGENGRQYDKGYDLTRFGQLQGLGQQNIDNRYRDAVFNANQGQKQFDNLFNMQSLAPGARVNPVDTSGYYQSGVAAGNAATARNDAMYGGIAKTVGDLAKVDWSSPAKLEPITVTAKRR